ncbi:MAG: hypothetical protein PQ975_06245, partial [Methanobacterium sp.]
YTTTRVSVATNGTESGGYSSYIAFISGGPSISSDGRYIAFSSSATNLVVNDTIGHLDVFVHDRLLNTTTLVSVSSEGSWSHSPSISADGRYIAFVWSDYCGVRGDIFVYDQISGTLESVSVSSERVYSWKPSISADGRYVAFALRDRMSYSEPISSQVLVSDRISNTTIVVSISNTGALGIGYSTDPSINADGRYIAFSSSATNLVVNDTIGHSDVFVHDRLLNTTTLVSVSSEGSWSHSPSISADGRYIAFVWSDYCGVRGDIFVYDQISGTLERVSVLIIGGARFGEPSISADGRYVAFTLREDEELMVAGIGPISSQVLVSAPISQVLVHDRILNTTRVVSISNTGALGNRNSDRPSINADGSVIAFSSWADNLVANDTNNLKDVFVHISTSPEAIPPVAAPPEPVTPPVADPPEPATPVVTPPVADPPEPATPVVTPPVTPPVTPCAVTPPVTPPVTSPVTPPVTPPAVTPPVTPRAVTPRAPRAVRPPVFTPRVRTPVATPPVNLIDFMITQTTNSNSWRINNQNSIYGRFAGILNNPLNPFSPIFYTVDKLTQAGQKAWRTGNIWDFFDFPFIRFYGYSNLRNVWGGQNIKSVLEFVGIDRNGNISVGNFPASSFLCYWGQNSKSSESPSKVSKTFKSPCKVSKTFYCINEKRGTKIT